MNPGGSFVLGAAVALFSALVLAGYVPRGEDINLGVMIALLSMAASSATALITVQAVTEAKAQVHASRTQAQAAVLPQRMAIYQDVRDFLGAWFRDGHPNLAQLPLLISAWERAHFVFGDETIQFIRTLWLDSVDADMAFRISIGDVQGDRQAAAQSTQRLMTKYFDNSDKEHAGQMAAFRGMSVGHWPS